MPIHDAFSSRAFRFIFVLLLASVASVACAEQTYWVGIPSIQRDFVLTGDSETPARTGVAVQMAAFIGTDEAELANYRFAFQLEVQAEDGTWSVVPLEGSDPDDFAYSESEPVFLTADPDDDAPTSVFINHETSLPPAQRLDPYASYRVVGQLQRQPLFGSYGDVENPHTSSTSRLFHFTNTTSTDTARNVIVTLDSVSLENPFLLDGANVPIKRGFMVGVAFTARRWDAFNSAPKDPLVNFRFEIELRDAATGTSIPLANSSFSATRAVDTYDDSGAVPIPSTVSLSHNLSLRPLEQLDPVNGEYEVTVTITHVELSAPVTGNTGTLDDLQLYHFNGAVDFSGNQTVIDDFTRAPQPTASTSASYVAVTLNDISGHLAGREDYTFDAPSSVSLRLFPDGTAAVQSVGASIPVSPPPFSRDIATMADVRFERTDIRLFASGLQSRLTVFLPQGMGYSGGSWSRILQGTLSFTNTSLNDDLNPTASALAFSPSFPVHVVEETKPVAMEVSTITWNTQSGTFDLAGTGATGYVRAMESNYLATAPVPPEDQFKADNSGYYAAVKAAASSNLSIDTGADGSAKLSAAFTFNSGHFKTHFPYGSQILFDGGEMLVSGDAVADGKLVGIKPVTVHYGQSCADVECDDGHRTGRFVLDAPELSFTPDGGLTGAGDLVATQESDLTLSWGHIASLSQPGDPAFAQSIGEFSSGTFHMTGHFIPGVGGGYGDFHSWSATGQLTNDGPGRIHLSAVQGPRNLVRPGSPGDIAGNHDYAGINLKTSGDGEAKGTAIIAGQPVLYNLRACNKFYVRQGGVTGTVEAVPGSFPDSLTLYGYDFQFKYYGLGFLDSTTSPQRSFTSGAVSVPYPSDETFNFDGLSFTCLGGLDTARLPAGGLAARLNYWNADIDVAALNFVTSNSCDPTTPAFLTLGASAYSTLISEPLHGVIGITPNGQLVQREFSRDKNLEREITSRLRLPNNIGMDGPGDEVYALTAISEAYFNSYGTASSQSPGDGRLNFAAKIDVPFFEDLAAHVRTTASKNFNPDATLHLMGGWTENSETYFTSTFFDPTNRAFPSGVSEAVYLARPGAGGDPLPYLIHARQSWLHVVNLDYPLQWSPALRSFSSYTPVQGEDLLIVTIDHQLEYLSAENAELSFGAVYEGLPRINLANFAFNAIDEHTGVLQAATEAMQAEAVGALEDGLASMETLLSDQVDALLEDFLNQTVDPVISQLYMELQAASNSANSVHDWTTAVQDETRAFLVENVEDPSANLRHAIRQLSNSVGNASSLIYKVDTSLEDVQIALRAIHDQIYLVEGGVSLEPPEVRGPSDTIRGLLTTENGEYTIVQALVAQLISEVSGEIGSELAGMLEDVLEAPVAELNTLINTQLEDVQPTLERLREGIALLDEKVGEARAQLSGGGEFIAELQAILDAADAQIVAATSELQSTVEQILLADIPAPGRFVEFTEEELKQRIRHEIQDKLRELEFMREYQLVLRQRLYDLDLAIKEGIDSAFAQVNQVLKDLLAEYLTQFDDEINGFLGDLNAVVGAGELNGFAHINGDALRLLRIDAYLQLKVPDNMEFNGYLQIKQLESDGTGSCSYAAGGMVAKEVTIGAVEVPVSWISPGMSIDVEGKVTFTDFPVGLGGSIEMVEGEFGFEAFTVTDLGAAMSFGATENYLAAKTGLRFQSYELYGGVFFGQTCSIAPLELVNTEVANVLGQPDPTFSGAYVYGEAHIPVSEALLGIPASCMFRISAGVGAGAFYFVEGPTYGGQILLAASGEALCLVSIRGDISLVGAKVADDLRFSGRGRLSGSVGSCPFCVTFGKTLRLEYSNDRWSYEL